ncbi:UNVERIFIED_CONTAM: hypothetical protein FKN15_012704 [Acipenser sinensis]
MALQDRDWTPLVQDTVTDRSPSCKTFSINCTNSSTSVVADTEGYTGVQLQVTAENVGVMSIKGLEAGRYLAMSTDGQLCGSQTLTDERFFLEMLEENHYATYKARKYQDRNWYVGIKKNGSCKEKRLTSDRRLFSSSLFQPAAISQLDHWNQGPTAA